MLDILYFLTGGALSVKQKVKDSKKTNENRNKALSNGSHVYRDAYGRLKYDNMFVGHKNVDGHDCLVSEEPDGTYGKVIIDYYNGSLQEEVDKILSQQEREKLLNKIEAYNVKTKDKLFGYSYNKNGYEYFDISTGKKYKIVTFRSRVYNGYKYVKGKLYEDGNIIIFMDYEYRNWMVNDTGKFDEEEYWNNRFYDEINQKHDKGEICDLANRNYRYDEESLNRYLSKVKLHENEYCKYNFNDPLYYYTEVDTGRKYYLIVGGGLMDYFVRGDRCELKALHYMKISDFNSYDTVYKKIENFLDRCIMKVYEGKKEIHLYYYKKDYEKLSECAFKNRMKKYGYGTTEEQIIMNIIKEKETPYKYIVAEKKREMYEERERDEKEIMLKIKNKICKKWGNLILDRKYMENESDRRDLINIKDIANIKFKIENIEDVKDDYPELLKFFGIQQINI